MKKYIAMILLALLTATGAVLEALIEDLSPQLVQLNGLLTIICAGVLIGWIVQLAGRRAQIRKGQ